MGERLAKELEAAMKAALEQIPAFDAMRVQAGERGLPADVTLAVLVQWNAILHDAIVRLARQLPDPEL